MKPLVAGVVTLVVRVEGEAYQWFVWVYRRFRGRELCKQLSKELLNLALGG